GPYRHVARPARAHRARGRLRRGAAHGPGGGARRDTGRSRGHRIGPRGHRAQRATRALRVAAGPARAAARAAPPREAPLRGGVFATGVLLALVAVALFPSVAHAWTPGTHIYLGESVLANLHQLPARAADLLRAFPYDFLYGNIAADTSIAKKYAPVGRHCHAWHVGQEIFDLAHSDPLRAFGLGYLSHLAADSVAHNFFVP